MNLVIFKELKRILKSKDIIVTVDKNSNSHEFYIVEDFHGKEIIRYTHSNVDKNIYDLEEGTYTYTVSASGYKEKSGKIKVTEEDAEDNVTKKIEVLLKKVSSGGTSSSGGTYYSNVKDVTENKIDIKKDETESTTFVTDKMTFPDVKKSDWFYSAVEYACENNIINDTSNSRDLFDTKLMGILTPMPREVVAEFNKRYATNPKEATDWYFDFSKNLNYCHVFCFLIT